MNGARSCRFAANRPRYDPFVSPVAFIVDRATVSENGGVCR
jgi:hypothetical protein